MQEAVTVIVAKLAGIVGGLLSLGERLSPLYLAVSVAIAFFVWLGIRAQTGKSFFAWLFPRDVYLHASHIVDLKVFAFSRVLSSFGLIGRLALSTTVSAATIGLLAGTFGATQQSADLTSLQIAALALTFAAVADFSTYWIHRLHHENSVLWPFHSVHHSAEVLTPLTLYRKHPVYDLLGSLLRGLLVGITTGVVLYAFFGKVNVFVIGGANLVYCAFNFVGANLRHSHVWLSYGPVLERLFISPAQHQIHHSRAVHHRDRNYGEVFALWDWMFGTLYVPQGRETLEIGLADAEGNALPQPHGSLRAAMLVPFADSFAALRRVFRRRRGDAAVAAEKSA